MEAEIYVPPWVNVKPLDEAFDIEQLNDADRDGRIVFLSGYPEDDFDDDEELIEERDRMIAACGFAEGMHPYIAAGIVWNEELKFRERDFERYAMSDQDRADHYRMSKIYWSAFEEGKKHRTKTDQEYKSEWEAWLKRLDEAGARSTDHDSPLWEILRAAKEASPG